MYYVKMKVVDINK